MSDDVRQPGDGAAQLTQEHGKAGLFGEKSRIERLNRVRQLVFGSLDGLLVPLGVVSGVAGGTGNVHAVIVAGIAEAFAGALSMGAGEFISARSEAQVQRTEVAREREGIRRNPEYELREMIQLLAHEGVAAEDAERIAHTLARYPAAYQKTMVEKELGLQVDPATVQLPEAFTMAGSYLAGSIVPLIAYFFFPLTTALPISLLLTAIALATVGILKGRLASLNLWVSVIEVVIVGSVSALGGYLLGALLPHLLGY
jgi:VIT1/CCC1 family predicted Fe2+/Mn2+ transporter